MKQKPNKHKSKVKMARKMMTGFETRNKKKLGLSIWESAAWRNRRKQRQIKESAK